MNQRPHYQLGYQAGASVSIPGPSTSGSPGTSSTGGPAPVIPGQVVGGHEEPVQATPGIFQDKTEPTPYATPTVTQSQQKPVQDTKPTTSPNWQPPTHADETRDDQPNMEEPSEDPERPKISPLAISEDEFNTEGHNTSEHHNTNNVTNNSWYQFNTECHNTSEHHNNNNVTNNSCFNTECHNTSEHHNTNNVTNNSCFNTECHNTSEHHNTNNVTNNSWYQFNTECHNTSEHHNTNNVTNNSCFNTECHNTSEHHNTNNVTNNSCFNTECHNTSEHHNTNNVTNNSWYQFNTECHNTSEHHNTNNVTNNSCFNTECHNTSEHHNNNNVTNNSWYQFNTECHNTSEHHNTNNVTNNSWYQLTICYNRNQHYIICTSNLHGFGHVSFFAYFFTGFSVEMSIQINKEYTAGLNDATSLAYKEFETRIRSLAKEQYKGITGFINVFVKAFRKGSIIADYVVKTTHVIPNEIANANKKLLEAMATIAPVIGSVTSIYKSATPLNLPDLIYTGNTMTLKCGPPPFNITVGRISGAQWKFNGREIKNSERIKTTTSSMMSLLTVNSVILPDIGLYECVLKGEVMDFLQQGLLTGDEIKRAPVVRLQSKVNIKCKEGLMQPLQCCVQSSFKIQWFQATTVLPSVFTDDGETYCIVHNYQLTSCSGSQPKEVQFICKVDQPKGYQMTTAMTVFRDDVKCDDAQYGTGRVGDISTIGCDKGQEGIKSAVCQETGEWKLVEDTCILTQIKELLIDSQDLVVDEVPQFVANLSNTVKEEKTQIVNSSATISAIVEILNTIANVTTDVTESVMEKVLETVDVIIAEDARESWAVLNANETRNASSELLGSLETLSDGLVGEFAIMTQRILLNRTSFNNSFRADLNSSILLEIPNININNVFITTITFSTLDNVIPARNSSFDTNLFNATNNETGINNAINAAVVLININETIQNVTLSYEKLNSSLSLNPQCVFWNFTLLNDLGGWDDEGCTFVSDINNKVTCNCNHLTSFSILMATDVPPELYDALDIITYVGVGISLASLVICLIIEGYVWKTITRNSTALVRHVAIINTALSLIIADICFLIAASIGKNPLENSGEDYEVLVGPCSTATFFMHIFYLALFFWMLVLGLLLFYRMVMVFSHMSKSTMLAIAFSVGYGCPLIVAVTTVAVTAPGNGYIRRYYACWLNWYETKALLALVIPALTIVFINILIIFMVLYKMLRRGVGRDTIQAEEKHTLMIITRCVVILTPLFGLTWALGVGTMVSSTNKGLHISFAFFNSLQGFFILVFGTLCDSKIRSILSRKSNTGSNATRSTSGGIPSLSGLNWILRLRGRRDIYRVSEAPTSSSTGASESFINI
uniref:adhesion G protein-coupled receptor F5-like n=1 Tax=Semicossyphus pulcher TaxID=241346 RepID=UPI0037E7FD21